MITFAIFHVQMSDQSRDELIPTYRGIRADHSDMIDMAFRSAELFHSGCQKVVLTDHKTDLSRLPGDIRVVRYDIDTTRVMFERTVVQREFLRQHDYRSHVLWMDSDMLINNKLDSMFRADVDVGLTYRDNWDMPINGGLIAVCNERPEQVLAYFDDLVRIMREGYSESLTWFCDQYALIDSISREAFQRRRRNRLTTAAGVRLGFWPCKTYNYSPDNEWRHILWRNPFRRVMHFKGPRKRLMRPYWNAHLAGSATAGERWSHRVNLTSDVIRDAVDASVRRMSGPFERRKHKRAA